MKYIEDSLSLKTTLKGARVWLNNNASRRSGFVAGTPIEITYFFNKVIVRVVEVSKRLVVAGDIIDIENKKMATSFPSCDRVSVDYGDNDDKGYSKRSEAAPQDSSFRDNKGDDPQNA